MVDHAPALPTIFVTRMLTRGRFAVAYLLVYCWFGDRRSISTITSCARGDTICPRPSPIPVGAPAPRAPPSRRNVAVLSHAEYVSPLPAAAALRVNASPSEGRGHINLCRHAHSLLLLLLLLPRAGPGVVRIDPLRFLAGCHTRRLNQV